MRLIDTSHTSPGWSHILPPYILILYRTKSGQVFFFWCDRLDVIFLHELIFLTIVMILGVDHGCQDKQNKIFLLSLFLELKRDVFHHEWWARKLNRKLNRIILGREGRLSEAAKANCTWRQRLEAERVPMAREPWFLFLETLSQSSLTFWSIIIKTSLGYY